MPASRYQQTKHRKITGLVNAERAAKCFNCGHACAPSETFKGWCLRCFTTWKDTADPVMLEQARLGYSPSSCVPAPTSRQVEHITEAIIEPKRDEDFIPLVLFYGGQTIGRMQALWNFLKTMQVLELESTAQVFKLTQASHDTTHRCGLHAPVQKASLEGLFRRLVYAENFKPFESDHHLREYVRWFIANNRMFITRLTPIDRHSVWSKQGWRRPQKWPRLTTHWPFLQNESSSDHDVLLAVDQAIPKGIPEQWRQDMCQELMVAVLSGDVSMDALKGSARTYIKKVWNEHPLKFGHWSLDAPIWHGDNRTLGEMLAAQVEDDEPECDALCHHRPGFGALGDQLRAKQDGVALPDLSFSAVPEYTELDAEIAEVYRDERRPRHRRHFEGAR